MDKETPLPPAPRIELLMIYFLCWDGKDYRITSEIQEGKYSEVVQILCNQDEAERALRMYAEEGYGNR